MENTKITRVRTIESILESAALKSGKFGQCTIIKMKTVIDLCRSQFDYTNIRLEIQLRGKANGFRKLK